MDSNWGGLEDYRCASCKAGTAWSKLCRECKRRKACAFTELVASLKQDFHCRVDIPSAGTYDGNVTLRVNATCIPFRVTGKDVHIGLDDMEEALDSDMDEE